jgi:hypothetical protein
LIDVGIGVGFEPFGNYFEGALMIRAEVDSVNVVAGLDEDLDSNVPESFGLNQNYPNPFNPTTTIDFALASSGHAFISLYDIKGREIKNLVDRNLDAGHYSFSLNAGDLPSGMYFYRMMVQDNQGHSVFSSTRKMVLMK